MLPCGCRPGGIDLLSIASLQPFVNAGRVSTGRPDPLSIRTQINLLITVIMLAFVATLLAAEIDSSRRTIREELEAATRVTVQLMTNVISSGEGRAVEPEALRFFLRQLGRVRANDLRLYDDNERLLYQSPPSRYKVGRDAPDWFAHLVAPQTAPTVLVLPHGRLEIVPVVSRPILDAWDELVRVLWLASIFFVVGNVLVFWIASRALHPVRHIVEGLRRMGAGDFQARLPRFAVPEMDAISSTFNRMAADVEETIALRQKAREAEMELEQNRELTQVIQHHIEEERRSLARELHDELGQLVTGVRTIAASIVTRTQAVQPDVARAAQTIVEVSGRMYDAMHGMVKTLRPMALDERRLADALRDLVQQQSARHTEIAFSQDIEDDLGELEESIAIAVYRVVQECLTNVVRHSGAARAEVRVRRASGPTGPMLTIDVRDDGKGFDPAAVDPDERFGLLGMRERIQGVRGTFEVLTTTPGACVRVEIPLTDSHTVAA